MAEPTSGKVSTSGKVPPVIPVNGASEYDPFRSSGNPDTYEAAEARTRAGSGNPSDTDSRPESPHHTLGWKPHQAAPGHETKRLLDAAGGIPVVHHGSNAAEPRPSGAVVYWIGAAEPENAEPYDLWYPKNPSEES